MIQPRRILLADADAFYVAVARMVDPEGAGKEPLLIVGELALFTRLPGLWRNLFALPWDIGRRPPLVSDVFQEHVTNVGL